MRVLLVTPHAPGPLAPLARALADAGHTPVLVAPEPLPDVASHPARLPAAGAAREAALAAQLLRHLVVKRPGVALVALSAHTSATAGALAAARIPYVLFADAAPPRPPTAVEAEARRAALRGAAAVVVGSDAAATALAEDDGLDEMDLLPPGVDLGALPLGDRDEAKAALRLPPALPVVGLVGALEPAARLDLVALAHRRLAGTALLVAGDGPEGAAVFAMSAATRPSSPVIHVGPLAPATRLIVACAADAMINLRADGALGEAPNLAALGRRQILHAGTEADALAAVYPDHPDALVWCEPSPDALESAVRALLAAEAERPLPADAVQRARAQLDLTTRGRRLADTVLACA